MRPNRTVLTKKRARRSSYATSREVARVRAKRTEWRMRGIEPNNKRNVVFPSSVLPSRCYGNPPSPEGEGLIGCVHSCHFECARRFIRSNIIKPNRHVVISSVSREIPYNRNGTLHIRASLPAGGGSLPLVAEATVSASARFSRYGYAYAQNGKL